MRILLVFPVQLCASLKIGCMAGWTQSYQEGWRLHLLKRPHRPLIDKGSETTLPLTVLAAPAALRSYIVSSGRSDVVGR